jgi:hypothetical protein
MIKKARIVEEFSNKELKLRSEGLELLVKLDVKMNFRPVQSRVAL